MCRGYKSEWIQHHSWVSRMQESKEASSGRWSKSAGNPAGGQQEMQVNFPKRLLLKALNDFFFFFAFLTELVRFRFQQSGLSLFCSSAKALASMVYILLSSFFIFFHLSPRMTLMALGFRGSNRRRRVLDLPSSPAFYFLFFLMSK